MSKTTKVKVKIQPVVVMESEVARKIRQHCRTSMKAEVCGVLIGESNDERTLVDACIAGENAAQGGAHVTFTQDTWEHIYQIKDKQYPEQKIVGWYHSHPGFGVFLSEHDLFIHENFFSSPQQIAWVYDPHTDEEGCFGWISGKIEKLSGVRFGYSQNVEISPRDENGYDEEGDAENINVNLNPQPRGKGTDDEPAWVKWTSRILSYFAVAVLGFGLGYLFFEYKFGPVLETYQQILQHPLDACQQLLAPYMTAPPGRGPAPQNSPAPAPPEKAPATKGDNGKR